MLSILMAGIRSMIDIDRTKYLWKEEERFLVVHSNRPERVRNFGLCLVNSSWEMITLRKAVSIYSTP